MAVKDVKKVVLAYSGGLDTSVILRWLQTTYRCEVVTFTADLGQGEELGPARQKAEMFGVKEIFVDDLRETFVRDFVFPMFRANALYEGQYLLGTSIARPLIAQRQIEIAEQVGADAVAHGATGKGNDQVRFELSLLRAEARHQDHRTVARMGPDQPHEAAGVRRAEPDPDRQGQARRGAVQRGCQPAALVVGGKDPGRPRGRGGRDRLSAHHPAGGRARPGDRDRDRFRARRSGGDRRRARCRRPRC